MFRGEDILEFTDKFKTNIDCLAYLAEIKWSNGYTCPKYGSEKYTIRKANLARDCNRCHHIDCPTANTLFHKIKFSLRKAFTIIFEMSARTKGLSAFQVAKRYSIRRTTAWSFMHKIRKAMEGSGNYPIEGEVQVDEFVFGGKETLKQGRSNDSNKKKIIGAVSLTSDGKVSRSYFKKINDYSAKSLKTIFEEHIEKYLNEYSFRINRSICKDTIFHKLVERMMKREIVTYQIIKIST